MFNSNIAKKGDFLLYRWQGVIGFFIYVGSLFGAYSHVAWYYGKGDQKIADKLGKALNKVKDKIYVIESHWKPNDPSDNGVQIHELKTKGEIIEIWAWEHVDMFPGNWVDLLSDEAINNWVGHPYDVLSFASKWVRSTLGLLTGAKKFRKGKPLLNSSRRNDCAEWLASAIQAKFGVWVNPNVHPQSMNPTDFARSKLLVKKS